MHKCINCGQEFDGKYCPECGTEWQDTCPNCGKKLEGAAKFCPDCGYSFVKKKAAGSDFKSKLSTCGKWIKSHLKIVIPVIVAVVLVIILSCTIPAIIAAQNNGTYYKMNFDGTVDKDTYFIINSGKWEDEDGESGTYKLDGEKIVFYYEFFGTVEEIAETKEQWEAIRKSDAWNNRVSGFTVKCTDGDIEY